MIPGSKNEGVGGLNSRKGKEKMKVKYHIGHFKRNLIVLSPSEKPKKQGSCHFGQRLRLHTSSSFLRYTTRGQHHVRQARRTKGHLCTSGARCGKLAEAYRAMADNDEVMRNSAQEEVDKYRMSASICVACIRPKKRLEGILVIC